VPKSLNSTIYSTVILRKALKVLRHSLRANFNRLVYCSGGCIEAPSRHWSQKPTKRRATVTHPGTLSQFTVLSKSCASCIYRVPPWTWCGNLVRVSELCPQRTTSRKVMQLLLQPQFFESIWAALFHALWWWGNEMSGILRALVSLSPRTLIWLGMYSHCWEKAQEGSIIRLIYRITLSIARLRASLATRTKIPFLKRPVSRASSPVLRIVFSDIFSAVSRLVDITQWYYLQWDIMAWILNMYGTYSPYTNMRSKDII
jgi:hypothetical protein